MEKRWILISAVMHAVLLTGVVLASRPVVNPVPTIFEVSLVSAAGGDRTGEENLVFTAGKHWVHDPRNFAPTPGKPEESSVAAVVNVKAGQNTQPQPEPIMAAVPDPILLQERKIPPEMEKGPERLTENVEKTPVKELETESVNRNIPEEEKEAIISADIEEDTGKPDDTLHMGDPVLIPQHSTLKPRTSLLAFTGDSSSLSGMISKQAGDGTWTGTGSGTGSVRPEIVSMPEPAYPFLSRKLGEEGRVVLEVFISEEGKVRSAEVIESSSYPRLDKAALLAVKKATFKPARKYGASVESDRKVAYVFRLENEK